MSDLKKDVKDEAEKLADHIVHPDHETDKEAKKRQPWMPIAGSIIAGIILLSIYFVFLAG